MQTFKPLVPTVGTQRQEDLLSSRPARATQRNPISEGEKKVRIVATFIERKGHIDGWLFLGLRI